MVQKPFDVESPLRKLSITYPTKHLNSNTRETNKPAISFAIPPIEN